MKMTRVTNGAVVELLFTGSLLTGEIFDGTDDEPITLCVGDGTIVCAFEREIIGMAVDQSKTFQLDSEQLFGARDEKRRSVFRRAGLDAELRPEVGSIVAVELSDGQMIPGTITSFDDETVEVDVNHPLSGKTLQYSVQVVSIQPPESDAPAAL